jgi:hypothetical protein
MTFPQLKIRPTAIVIRLAPGTSTGGPPASFIFDGWDAAKQCWVVVCDRQRLRELPMISGCRLTAIDSENAFSEFEFTHTESHCPATAHFSLMGLGLHCRIQVMDMFPLPEIPIAISEDHEEFDPWHVIGAKSKSNRCVFGPLPNTSE